MLIAVGLGLGIVPFSQASASCTGPVLLGSQPDSLTPASTILPLRAPFTVTGVAFNSGCADTGGQGGCRADGGGSEKMAPLKSVALVLEQGAHTQTLATSDATAAGKRYLISWSGRIPAGFVEGSAVLRAAGATLSVDLRP